MSLINSKSGYRYLGLIAAFSLIYAVLTMLNGAGLVVSSLVIIGLILAAVAMSVPQQAMRQGKMTRGQTLLAAIATVVAWYILYIGTRAAIEATVDPVPKSWTFWILPFWTAIWVVYQWQLRSRQTKDST